MPAGSDSPSEDEGTWEIRKEQAAGAVDFCVYLNGRRIGMEKNISDLWSLFAGVGVKSEDAERAIYELGSRRAVQVQLHLPVTKLHL
jgi:hypothetical protein